MKKKLPLLNIKVRKKLRISTLFIVVILLFISIFIITKIDNKNSKIIVEKKNNSMIFIGHCYYWYDLHRLDKRIESLDFSSFDKIFLGGDLLGGGTLRRNELNYLDSIFNVKSKNTFWSFGNHDLRLGSIDTFKLNTNKVSFYTQYDNNITYLVLNTNLDSCYLNKEESEAKHKEQIQLINNVCDTIVNSSYLIVLTHNIVWYNLDTASYKYAHVNGSNNLFYHKKKTFENDLYPLLKRVQKSGVNIIWLAGDAGKWGKGNVFVKDGISFIASGIGNSRYENNIDILNKTGVDKILLLNYNYKKDTIEYRFEELNFLLNLQKIKKNGVKTSLDSLITDIDSMKTNRDLLIKKSIYGIYNNKKWMKSIEIKANKNKLPVDEQIRIDAVYLYNSMLKEKVKLYKSKSTYLTFLK